MHRNRISSLVVVAAVAVSTLVACGGDDDDSGGEVTAADLDGRSFVATSIEGHEIVEGTQVAVSFADGSISVQPGCNTHNGSYELDGDVLIVGQMASTMMMCLEPETAQDELVVGLITASPTVALDGDDLTLTSGDTVMSLTATT